MNNQPEKERYSWAVGMTSDWIGDDHNEEMVNFFIGANGLSFSADDARFMAQQLLICANRADEIMAERTKREL